MTINPLKPNSSNSYIMPCRRAPECPNVRNWKW